MPSDYDALLAEPPVDQKSPYDALLPAQVDTAPIIPRSGAQMESLGAREFLATPDSTAAGDIRGTGDQPVIPIPRIPQQEGVVAQLGAGAVNAAANLAETFETPQLISSLPVMPMKLTQLLFGGQALSDIKTAYEEAARPETTVQKGLELGGRALTDALFGVGMVHGAVGGLAEPRSLTPKPDGLTESLFGKPEVQPEQSQLLEKVNEGLAAGEQPTVSTPAAETPTPVSETTATRQAAPTIEPPKNASFDETGLVYNGRKFRRQEGSWIGEGDPNFMGGSDVRITTPSFEDELNQAYSQKASPVSKAGVEPSAPVSKKSGVETPPTVSQTTPEGQATIDTGSKPVTLSPSTGSEGEPSRIERTDVSASEKGVSTSGESSKESTTKHQTNQPSTGAPPVASPVSESGLELQAPVSKEAAKIESGVAPTEAGQPEPPSGVTALTPDSQPPEVGPNVKGFEKVYGPGEIKAGDSVTPEEIFRSGQADLASGKDPYAIADRARTGDVSPKEIGLLAAEHDRLLHEAVAAEGTPEYEAKYQQAKDFAQNMLKPAGTKWHQTGMGLQVKAPIDLSSLTGFRAAFDERFGKEMTPDQANSFSQIAKDVARAKAEDAVELGRTAERVRQRFKGVKDISFEDAVKSLHDEIAKKLKDCNL